MAEAVAATSWQFLGWTGTAEMVAPLANMVESALAGGVLPILQPPGESAMVAASTNADLQGGVGGDDAGRAQGERFAPAAGRDRVCAPVDAGAGPRTHRVHCPPVRAGRPGGSAGLAGQRHRGDRSGSGPVGTHG